MLYSALNVRPYLNNGEDQLDWYHIAIGYYKCVLTSLPSGSYGQGLNTEPMFGEQHHASGVPPVNHVDQRSILASRPERQEADEPDRQIAVLDLADALHGQEARGAIHPMGARSGREEEALHRRPEWPAPGGVEFDSWKDCALDRERHDWRHQPAERPRKRHFY